MMSRNVILMCVVSIILVVSAINENKSRIKYLCDNVVCDRISRSNLCVRQCVSMALSVIPSQKIKGNMNCHGLCAAVCGKNNVCGLKCESKCAKKEEEEKRNEKRMAPRRRRLWHNTAAVCYRGDEYCYVPPLFVPLPCGAPWITACETGCEDQGFRVNGGLLQCSDPHLQDQNIRCPLTKNSCAYSPSLFGEIKTNTEWLTKLTKVGINSAAGMLSLGGPGGTLMKGALSFGMGMADNSAEIANAKFNELYAKLNVELMRLTKNLQECIGIALIQSQEDDLVALLSTIRGRLTVERFNQFSSAKARDVALFLANEQDCEEIGARFERARNRNYVERVLPYGLEALQICVVNMVARVGGFQNFTSHGVIDVTVPYKQMANRIISTMWQSIRFLERSYSKPDRCGTYTWNKDAYINKISDLYENILGPSLAIRYALNGRRRDEELRVFPIGPEISSRRWMKVVMPRTGVLTKIGIVDDEEGRNVYYSGCVVNRYVLIDHGCSNALTGERVNQKPISVVKGQVLEISTHAESSMWNEYVPPTNPLRANREVLTRFVVGHVAYEFA